MKQAFVEWKGKVYVFEAPTVEEAKKRAQKWASRR